MSDGGGRVGHFWPWRMRKGSPNKRCKQYDTAVYTIYVCSHCLASSSLTCAPKIDNPTSINSPLFQPTPQIPSSAIRTEAVTFNSGIRAERGRRREEEKCPSPLLLGQKLGFSSPRGGPAFLLALTVLVTVAAMSALPASCEKAAASGDLGRELSRPQMRRPESRMLVSRPRQPRLTKEWRQQRPKVTLLQARNDYCEMKMGN